jgi:nucleotidyltransferase/DNA polymerase involved in DNA repair
VQEINIVSTESQQLISPHVAAPDSRETMPLAERARVRQGVMCVRIEHFYATLEEIFDPTLQGLAFVVGTGTGRPNEPGRVLDVSQAAQRQGLSAGMSLRRAYRLAPRARFLPASYDRYQPILQKLKERYRAYSRIIESAPISDAFIDLRGCEISFDTPVVLAERLCAELAEMGLTALIGVANGKSIAEMAALMSRKDGRQGVLYIPPGCEASFVQTLPLSVLLKMRGSDASQHVKPSDSGEHIDTPRSQNGLSRETHSSLGAIVTRQAYMNGKGDLLDPAALAEMVSHLRDFGITTFVQVASLDKEGLVRRLGPLGGWLHQVSHGEDERLVIPDAPPLSQNARVRFPLQANADETCAALRQLSDYLSERLKEQRLKGQSIALILWPNTLHRESSASDDHEDIPPSVEETIGGQMMISRHTDQADIIAYHSLMLFAHYHQPGICYLQAQLRVGDIITSIANYSPPSTRTRKLTRRL